ncbi:hypothetical protein ACVLV4_001857 [Rathayibacter agropyri]
MMATHSVRRPVALCTGICGFALLAILCPSPPAATAQSLRDQIPVVAGTALGLQGAHRCTAGPVLRSRSWISRTTPVRRATRYVVLAKHCANLGDELTVDGTVVGTVSWVSPNYDLELVNIPPSVVQRPVCSGASQLHHCTVPDATPRAVGRIILNNGLSQEAVPVRGFGIPTTGERLCTSGSVTFVNCAFGPVAVPAIGFAPGDATALTYNGNNITSGDSGGPVASTTGRLYGIILRWGLRTYRGIMGYLPMPTILQDLGYSYGLAPA